MSAIQHLTGFAAGETVRFSILARTPGGAVLPTPGTAVVTVTIGATQDGDAIVTGSTTGGQVVLSDTDTARFDVTFTPAALAALGEGVAYWYNVWTTQGGVVTRQAYGRFTLKRSIAP
jgi:hypothetical protein